MQVGIPHQLLIAAELDQLTQCYFSDTHTPSWVTAFVSNLAMWCKIAFTIPLITRRSCVCRGLSG